MYKKILVPVDGSEGNLCALQEASQIKALSGATILLFHVVDALQYSSGLERPSVFLDYVLPAMRRNGYRILNDAHKVLERANVDSEFLLEESDDRRISQIILDRAQRWGADLIVMATHGRRGLDRLFMGSVAEGVARGSPVPVLLVRPAPRTDD
ncbi:MULTISPECIES: universal stress protein [unclassified Achromobacter]|uniref:universal stress protein n=1 Tax=unclassified Achromobacter TaxID=2626865 RepID=UPI000B518E02|nr:MULTISPECIES: universal stress protein [unclassified Achromobacter]OWT74700.1 universal stress protein UspA [Achromobacter sp. HZ34]OWT79167.1 universal stress protein UspA [Achromobacter sp. HZ28]